MKVEHNVLIAERVPPGDNWRVLSDGPSPIIEGLVEALTEYMRTTGFKGNYRLEPLNGKLFAIEEDTIPEPPQKVYDLYGEG